MDAAAYLTRHGWRGDGYSLDSKDRGLKKRLLVSKRQGQHGIGKKKYDAAADQWWQGAFDGALKGLNVGPNGTKKLEAAEEKTPFATELNPKWKGLYQGFVRGSTLGGTISQDSETSTGATTPTLLEKSSKAASGEGQHVRFNDESESASSIKKGEAAKVKKVKKSKSKRKREHKTSADDDESIEAHPPDDTAILKNKMPLKLSPRSERKLNSDRHTGHSKSTSKGKREK